ncbi:unnamed protein product [Blepharisma stoltei]|uniref:Uncharacterized protein n=1 Tax=Blepharisma stoltei TaxID=1481888 RepID=A0AAU9INC8_9CILI|nr:unnamed protein product [Blepharisma stoltei]
MVKISASALLSYPIYFQGYLTQISFEICFLYFIWVYIISFLSYFYFSSSDLSCSPQLLWLRWPQNSMNLLLFLSLSDWLTASCSLVQNGFGKNQPNESPSKHLKSIFLKLHVMYIIYDKEIGTN